MRVACETKGLRATHLRSATSNKPLEWTGHQRFTASPPRAACLPLRGSVRRMVRSSKDGVVFMGARKYLIHSGLDSTATRAKMVADTQDIMKIQRKRTAVFFASIVFGALFLAMLTSDVFASSWWLPSDGWKSMPNKLFRDSRQYIAQQSKTCCLSSGAQCQLNSSLPSGSPCICSTSLGPRKGTAC
jgi:hypothetical protein